jgi:hypothetical protein
MVIMIELEGKSTNIEEELIGEVQRTEELAQSCLVANSPNSLVLELPQPSCE